MTDAVVTGKGLTRRFGGHVTRGIVTRNPAMRMDVYTFYVTVPDGDHSFDLIFEVTMNDNVMIDGKVYEVVEAK